MSPSSHFSILVRFVDGSYSNKLNSTIGVDFKVKTIDVLDKDESMKKVKLTLWDTGKLLAMANAIDAS